jgi:RAD51-like protein 3
MRLRAILKGEPKTILEALESCNIKTDEDLLCSNTELATLFCRLPPELITFADLERIRDRVLDTVAAPGANGLELINKVNSVTDWKKDPKWTTGFSELDELLHWGESGIVEVSSPNTLKETVDAFSYVLRCFNCTDIIFCPVSRNSSPIS